MISFIRSSSQTMSGLRMASVSCNSSGADHSLLALLSENVLLSISFHLSNLDCDRKREHGISLSLESCFVKHKCKNQLTDWTIPRHFKMIAVKEIWFEFISIFCWYLFILHKYEKDWTIFMNIKLYKSQTTNKRAILETRYFAFICCL